MILFDGPQVRPAARLHRPQPADFWRAGPIPTLAYQFNVKDRIKCLGLFPHVS